MNIEMREEARPSGRSIKIDTVVIGGSQVGLTTGYHLKKKGREFVILDAGSRVGDSWRNRWDSLLLFTPNRYNGLPGMRFPAPAATYPTKDQMADYLEAYAAKMELPLKLNSPVLNLARSGDGFIVETPDVSYEASNVVVAMGSSQKPKIPAFAGQLDPKIIQLHSTDYRNLSQLQPGPVLIVGAGNSGADIGLEVAGKHPTIWSGKESAVVPFRMETVIARYLLTRIVRFVGMRVMSLKTPIGRKLRPKLMQMPAPLVRVKPKDLVNLGVKRVGRIVSVKDGLPVTEDGERLEVSNVIWCTGFRSSFSWINLPIFGERGEPIHERGVIASEPGLYFAGLHFQFSLASETVPGHQPDVRYVVERLVRRTSADRVAAR